MCTHWRREGVEEAERVCRVGMQNRICKHQPVPPSVQRCLSTLCRLGSTSSSITFIAFSVCAFLQPSQRYAEPSLALVHSIIYPLLPPLSHVEDTVWASVLPYKQWWGPRLGTRCTYFLGNFLIITDDKEGNITT